MSPADFAAMACKAVRQGGKPVWFSGHFEVSGVPVAIKAFGYWAQILRIGGLDHGGDHLGIKSGKAFRAYLESELAKGGCK